MVIPHYYQCMKYGVITNKESSTTESLRLFSGTNNAITAATNRNKKHISKFKVDEKGDKG